MNDKIRELNKIIAEARRSIAEIQQSCPHAKYPECDVEDGAYRLVWCSDCGLLLRREHA